MLTKPVNYGVKKKKKRAELKINNDKFRIGKQDERNWTIELETKPTKPEIKPTWQTIAYYGNIEDMVWGLIKLSVGIPKHEDLVEQVKLLRQELKQVEQNIVAQLKEVVEVEDA